MKQNFTIYPETAPFVEALRNVLQAENKVLDGFIGIYGEVGGDQNYQESGLPEAFLNLKNQIHTWIGTTFELGLGGCLEAEAEV